MKLKALLTSIMMGVAIVGCSNESSLGPENQNPETTYSLLKSDKSRLTFANVTSDQVINVVNGNNQFGFELMSEIAESNAEQNVLLSPYSIYCAFGMTYAGARTSTEEEMARVLHFTNQSEFHHEFNALQQSLETLNSTYNKLSINNSIWCDQGYYYENSFLDIMAEEYGTGIFELDFIESEKSRRAINGWVEEKTEKMIVELLPEHSLDGPVRLVLVNTIYLNALWQNQFNKDLTTKKTFYSGADQVSADFMAMSEPVTLKYLNNDTVTAVEMSYKESELVMDLVMPKNGKNISGFSSESFSATLESMTSGDVFVSMPKLSLKPGTFGLRDLFQALGMSESFTFSADFSGMTGTRDLCIDNAYHQVTLDVFETGTIAAAATAVVMIEKGMPQAEFLLFDHPFILSIRDSKTGAILFLGIINNPVQ